MARYKRMTGHNVLHPMGWDAFGLPAEQYALETGTHPSVTTDRNIAVFRQQLKALGFSYDWAREVSTTDPEYYKWTQWIFTKLLEMDLAYQAEVRCAACCAMCCAGVLGSDFGFWVSLGAGFAWRVLGLCTVGGLGVCAGGVRGELGASAVSMVPPIDVCRNQQLGLRAGRTCIVSGGAWSRVVPQ